MAKEILINLFEDEFGETPVLKEISGGGSSRKYYRLSDNDNVAVGVIGDSVKENETFLELDNMLDSYGINVPYIYQVSDNKEAYLMQDLGDVRLFDLLSEPDKLELAKRALKDLLKFQLIPENLWGNKVEFPPFSQRLVKWDLNYFKYDFLKPAGITFDEEKLEDDFDRLAAELFSDRLTFGLMYRDFQSRNVMVKNNQFYYIDFQGARKGPIVYDAVSFIWQAKAPFNFEERVELEKYYSEIIISELGIKKESIVTQFRVLKLFRILQVLGAYGFRGLIEKKSHFLQSIPFAVANLNFMKERGDLDLYPELSAISCRLNKKYTDSEESGLPGLTLKIYSFSYKKGYPEDSSGNGGGFMFDCRAIHNPGRYEEYKNLTGKNPEVKEFLEKREETRNFINNAYAMVTPSIERYLQRGFTSLQVGFGCTGGQHRSVYCADRFAEMVKKEYPEVNVEVNHREQNIREIK